jgi:hypothetical protein
MFTKIGIVLSTCFTKFNLVNNKHLQAYSEY